MINDINRLSWKARWIWTDCPLKEPFHFAYFRKTFALAKAPAIASIRVAADSRYRLWVNGTYIGFGPARGHARHPYYDTHEVRLRQGTNTIALLVEHYTKKYGLFAAAQGGLVAEVFADAQLAAQTDGTWRARSSAAHFPVPGWLYPEGFDARKEPEGWELPGFNDRSWKPAKVLVRSKLAPPGALLLRPIPLIREQRLAPVRLLDVGTTHNDAHPNFAKHTDIGASLWECVLESGWVAKMKPELRPQEAWRDRPVAVELAPGQGVYFTLDFGRNILAAPEVDIIAGPGVPGAGFCDLGYSEVLHNNRVATTWTAVKRGLAERIILRNGRTLHRINQPRGFRYMMLRLANPTRKKCVITLRDISAHLSIYPAQLRGEFRSSDPLLERVFKMSAWTVNLCMEDAFTDCPYRERQQWLGDFQPEALFDYYCFGAYDLARKAALEYARGNMPQGWIPGVFPTSKPSNLPTWGMRFPVAAWEYVLYTGDRTIVPQLFEGTRKQMAWLAHYEDRRGLLVDVPGWKFVDWTALDSRRNEGAMQGWYLEALEHAAKLARLADDPRSCADYLRRAKKLRRTLAQAYWSKSRGAFLKYRPGSLVRPPNAPTDLIGQHENFLFYLLDVGTPAQRKQALEAIAGAAGLFLPDLGAIQNPTLMESRGNFASERTILIGSPFWSFYALLALMKAGKVTEALDYIRIGWGTMLDNGATTCWEVWGRHMIVGSLCHGWSAAPAMILPAYILGVRPLTPGFRTFEVRPRPGNLHWAQGTVPTPHGDIRVSWKRRAKSFACQITVPEGTKARFVADHLGSRRTVVLGPGRHVL